MSDEMLLERRIAVLAELAGLVSSFDPSPAPLADYIREPAARWVVQRIMSGGQVPMNGATSGAIGQAIRELSWVRPIGAS